MRKSKAESKIEHQRRYFNTLGKHYAEGNKWNLPTLEEAKKIISPYIKGDVLDIGNGGSICFDFKNAKTVTLADIAIELLKEPKLVGKGRFKPVDKKYFHCVEANVMKMPFKDKSFSVVILLFVAHHLSTNSIKHSRANIVQAFKEISRVLKTDGVFILAESCPFAPLKLVFTLVYPFFYFFLKQFKKPLPYFLSYKEITDLLSKNHLEVTKTYPLSFGEKAYQPLFPFYAPPGWLWQILLPNKLLIIKKSGDE